MKNYSSVAQAAKVLCVQDQTILAYIRSGKLRASKVARKWLIDEAEIQNLIDINQRPR